MKKCFAVAISVLIILMSCSEHKKVEKVLTWEDSVDMALKGYVYLNYPDSSDFLIRNRKVAYRNDTLCIVFVDAITTLEDNTLGPVEMEFSMWKRKMDGNIQQCHITERMEFILLQLNMITKKQIECCLYLIVGLLLKTLSF